MTEKVSVIIAVHDQAIELEQNLPLFLTQQYAAGYEVIVVEDSSTDETPDVLKRLKAEHSHLYTTFLPQSVVYNPNRQQLALTIGAKAAHHPLLVLADILRPPVSETWLQELADAAGHDEVVLTYSNRRRQAEGVIYQSWERLEEVAPLIRKAERHSGRGHRGRWLKFRRGLYDAVAVRQERIYDAVRLFDQRIGAARLWRLRGQVYWKNLFS